MMRESVFVCSCRLEKTVHVAHIRAWDEDEAADLFIHEMNEEGVRGARDVRVRAVAGARASSPSRH